MQRSISISVMAVLIFMVPFAQAQERVSDTIALKKAVGVKGTNFETCLAMEQDLTEMAASVAREDNSEIGVLVKEFIVCSVIEKENEFLCDFVPPRTCESQSSPACKLETDEEFTSSCKNIYGITTKIIEPLLKGESVSEDVCKEIIKGSGLDPQKKEIICSSVVKAVSQKDCSNLEGKEGFDLCQAFLSDNLIGVISEIFPDKARYDNLYGVVLFRYVPRIHAGKKDICNKIYNNLKKEYCTEIAKEGILVP